MKLVENVPLDTHSAMAVGGCARFGAELYTEDDVRDLHHVALRKQLPFFVIGEGTNTLFDSGTLAIVVGFMKLHGITIVQDNGTQVIIQASAGEKWDDLVAWTVTKNLCGLEALSYIPGTVGAAPIQNIGAYGSEFKDVCQHVTVYDTQTRTTYSMPSAACAFAYRDSIFKQQPGRFVVLSVTIALSRTKPALPDYKDVRDYLTTTTPQTVQEIRDAIIAIRTRKLPDYTQIPNLGSFFKNPIVSTSLAAAIKETYPTIPYTTLPNGLIKLYAGWLIEHADLLGKEVSGLVVHERNALILTNPQRLPYESVECAEQEIVARVYKKFGITLEREPVLIR